MDPYIVAGIVILMSFITGGFAVYYNYKNRTQEPDVDAIKDEIVDKVTGSMNIDDALNGRV